MAATASHFVDVLSSCI